MGWRLAQSGSSSGPPPLACALSFSSGLGSRRCPTSILAASRLVASTQAHQVSWSCKRRASSSRCSKRRGRCDLGPTTRRRVPSSQTLRNVSHLSGLSFCVGMVYSLTRLLYTLSCLLRCCVVDLDV